MDAEEIVREMRKNGQSKEDIISNLQDLGIPNPEKYYERVISEEGKGVLEGSSKPEGIKEPEVESILGNGGKNGDPKYSEAEGEAKDILHSETKSLFETKSHSIYNPAPSPAEKERADKAVEDIPELEITSIKDGEEKVSDIEEMLGKRQAPQQVMKSMPQMSLQRLDEVERKLDEMISITKAVYEIDRKILEANRDLILRLKAQKT
jgi:hypothetical protein